MNTEYGIKFTHEINQRSNMPTPWISERTLLLPNPILRLHNQTIQFAEYVTTLPDSHQHIAKKMLINKLERKINKILIQNGYNDIKVLSPLFNNHLYFKGAELQIYVVLPELPEHLIVNTLATKLSEETANSQMGEEAVDNTVLKIYSSTVDKKAEQIRLIGEDASSQTIIWLNFVSEEWVSFLNYAEHTPAVTPELRYLFLINSCIVRQRSLHYQIRSLLVFGLCSFFMFERRRQRARTLTENIIKFLEFFGIGPTHERRIVFISEQGNGKTNNFYECTVGPEQKTFVFMISPKVDLATHKLREYFKVIQNRYRVIGNYYYEPKMSVLVHLVNPCQAQFFY